MRHETGIDASNEDRKGRRETDIDATNGDGGDAPLSGVRRSLVRPAGLRLFALSDSRGSASSPPPAEGSLNGLGSALVAAGVGLGAVVGLDPLPCFTTVGLMLTPEPPGPGPAPASGDALATTPTPGMALETAPYHDVRWKPAVVDAAARVRVAARGVLREGSGPFSTNVPCACACAVAGEEAPSTTRRRLGALGRGFCGEEGRWLWPPGLAACARTARETRGAFPPDRALSPEVEPSRWGAARGAA